MSLLTFSAARQALLDHARPVAGTELVSTLKASGRVLAEDLREANAKLEKSRLLTTCLSTNEQCPEGPND